MTEVLVILAAMAAFGLCGFLTAVGLVRWRLGRHNRVDPAVASPAPIRWLASPGEAARTHRRLRAVARVSAVDPELDEHTTAEILAVATRLDRRVVLAAAGPPSARREAMRSLRAEADELERLARRLARPMTGPEGRREVDTLALLADARDEIEALDRATHPA